MTHLQEKELILFQLCKLKEICQNEDYELLSKEFKSGGEAVIIKPFGTFEFSVNFTIESISELILKIEKYYPKDINAKKVVSKAKIYTAPNYGDNYREKAIQIGSLESIELDVTILTQNLELALKVGNTALFEAFNERLIYMKNVLRVAKGIDFEVINNADLQALPSLIEFHNDRFTHREVLDNCRKYGFEINLENAIKACAYSLFEETNETAHSFREKLLNELHGVQATITNEFFTKKGAMKKLRGRAAYDYHRNALHANRLIFTIAQIDSF